MTSTVTIRYNDTEERLNLLFLLSELLAIFLSEKESNAFLTVGGISPPPTFAKLIIFSFHKRIIGTFILTLSNYYCFDMLFRAKVT